ncbi:MAG: 2-oxoglutarate dehydrogenase complex dihydrolipoyllysine-residue succinyltransferase [Planctomycetaceae bacterium]|nr:2-oxoglutarate dehydrogenase complex dihydrolipoyllysine-residue succinyltransferase [Planctomycetaceae bacterium]
MTVNVIVPRVGDSVSEILLGTWLKKVGERVAADEPLVEYESEKSSDSILSPSAGVLTQILKPEGETVPVDSVIAVIDPAGVPKETAAPAAGAPAAAPAPKTDSNSAHVMPAAARAMAESGVTAAQVQPTGPGGRVLKEDVQRATAPASAATPAPKTQMAPVATPVVQTVRVTGQRAIRRQTMSPIRKAIAQNLLSAQQNAALLTTFNEIDMTAVMALRKQHQDAFTERHGIKLGFMSFFVKAAVDALQAFPAINAYVEGNEIVFHDYCDIGIAIGGGKGLVVPVIRNAETLTFAQIEQTIAEYAKRAQSGQIKPDEFKGGTFTITNGGVYGSLLSTPIVNPPQSGVLGMHATQDRPVVRDGQIVARPMMYIALTYDHRVVDGREAVSFLKRIKDCIENPVRLLLEV